jgi:ANTAR domain
MTDLAGAIAQVCSAVLAGVPVRGAAFTVMTSDAGREPLWASDPVMDQLEGLQFDLGEGPALETFTDHRPVLIADLTARTWSTRWPIFTPAALELGVGCLFAFPMRLGAITVGVCQFYRPDPGPLADGSLGPTLRAVDRATLALLALRSGQPPDETDMGWLDGHSTARQRVHQAIGMLIVQLGVPGEQAFARLRGYAFVEGRTIEQVAADIVDRTLRLDPDAPLP